MEPITETQATIPFRPPFQSHLTLRKDYAPTIAERADSSRSMAWSPLNPCLRHVPMYPEHTVQVTSTEHSQMPLCRDFRQRFASGMEIPWFSNRTFKMETLWSSTWRCPLIAHLCHHFSARNVTVADLFAVQSGRRSSLTCFVTARGGRSA